MDSDTYPDKFWHCYVALPGIKKNARGGVVNDLTFEELQKQIIEPWKKNVPFAVSGLIVSDHGAINEVRIAHTPYPWARYSEEHYASMRSRGVTDLATDTRYLPFSKGVDYTNDLLFGAVEVAPPQPDVALVLQLCERIPLSAGILRSRRNGKAPFQIQDEYDVQDLLHAVIRAFIKYSIVEEPLGKVGGVRSSRADIAIEDLGVLIEIKFARGPSDQQRLVEDFAEDLLLYSAWGPLRTFVYLVYNSGDLRDPEALQKLQGNTEINNKKYRTYIILA